MSRYLAKLLCILPFLLIGATACTPVDSIAPAATPLTEAATMADPQPGSVVCANRNPLRSAFFGELHVHTALSLDAFSFFTSAGADDAYRFAKGESIEFAGGRTVQLERPLDFAAITDHAETMGELRICTTPGSAAYDTHICRVVRGRGTIEDGDEFAARESPTNIVSAKGVGRPERNATLCGEDFALCLAAMDSVWKEHQRAAERHQDRTSACSFTTFNAYEYSATPDLAKVHRNVIFKNERVPQRVVSWVDEPSRWGLWEWLDRECLEAGTGCDALTIPHNSNMSNGQMFAIDYREEPLEEQIRRARLWQKLEPLVETMQTKGDSECRNGLWQVLGGPDPQCDFEKWRAIDPAPAPCRDEPGFGAILGQGCQSRLDFTRYALVEGLREEARIGVNPIKIGNTASTDMHNANPGDTEEISFDGVLGAADATPAGRLTRHMKELSPAAFNPGGLVGVWAKENSREALFTSMKNRETFGTSGTRIEPRFFGGWNYPTDLCEDPAFLAHAYAGGVAMGGDLPARPDDAAAPVFIVSAQRDPGIEGAPDRPLQKIQIIKAWPGAGDAMHQVVVDVAGDSTSDATVNPETCEARGRGYDSLCGVWTDPAFDPAQNAVYYARVLENPTCRWSTLECNSIPPDARPDTCDDPLLPKTIQERAWTSPIWFNPERDSTSPPA